MIGHVVRNGVEGIISFLDNHVAQFEPAIVDRPAGHTDDDEGQADPVIAHRGARIRQPSVQFDHHGTGSFRNDRAAQLGKECLDAESFEDRETLPCRPWTIPGWSAGRTVGLWL